MILRSTLTVIQVGISSTADIIKNISLILQDFGTSDKRLGLQSVAVIVISPSVGKRKKILFYTFMGSIRPFFSLSSEGELIDLSGWVARTRG